MTVVGNGEGGTAARARDGGAGHQHTLAALERIAEQPDEQIDVAETALLLASFDHPATDLAIYRAHLRELVAAVTDRAAALDDMANASPEAIAGVLTDVLYGEFRYTGDEETYDDLDNANLMRVIERRKGLPVALGILYLAAARGQGWAAAGLNFPGHFLIRVESGDGRRVILDPFHAGRIMETPALRELLKVVAGQAVELESGHYRAVSNRDILLRLQNNVKTSRLDLGMMEGALEALTRMQILSPTQAALWREAGIIHMRLGRLKHAVACFEGFIARAPDNSDRRKIAQVVEELRDRLH